MSQQATRIGIDIGGTFTDFVVYHPHTHHLATFKLPTTPGDPAQAVLAGLRDIAGVRHIIHGSTVATNALLERTGARTALITTRGFRDVLQIGRQNRPALYDLFADPPAPLVPRPWRLEVTERVDMAATVLSPLDIAEVDALLPYLRAENIESVAICLLFSFLHPQHEQTIAAHLRHAGFFTSASHEILPEYREYERASTTVVNAYVSPILNRYIANLESALNPVDGTGNETRHTDLRIMQSNGGSIRTSEARRNGVRCIVSGPAGGVLGAFHVARMASTLRAGWDVNVIAFDMGGTSTDVSLCKGAIQTTSEASLAGVPIHIPIIDIHTVGAGGGSIAAVDQGGALRVGPQSAGAVPGPACYGRSQLPTVTDANVVLGRLPGKYFLGGQMILDENRAQQALETMGQHIGLSAVDAARGVIEVVNTHMERALRVISVERGFDPAQFTLVSFGGAGGLHAVELARRLGITAVLISPYASTLSACGMLIADIVKDYSLTVMLPGATPDNEFESRLAPLVARGLQEVSEEGFTGAAASITVERALDMRYLGQSYELSVPFGPNFRADFHAAHHRAYGYSRPEAATEIVTVRVKVIGRETPPVMLITPAAGADPAGALLEYRAVMLDTETIVPFYRGENLRPGNIIPGPAIVIRSDTTILLDRGDRATVDGYLNLVIDVAPVIRNQKGEQA